MSGEASIGHGPRARPVADAPIEGLLARTDDLAKRWVLAIAGACTLAEIATLPFAQFANGAPSLCGAVLRALRSDDALAEDPAHGARGAADDALGGLTLHWSDDPREVAAAVEALRAVLWEALVHAAGTESLGAPSYRLLRDLADRLAYVCGIVLARSLPPVSSRGAHEPPPRGDSPAPVAAPPWAAPVFPAEPTVHRGQPIGPPAARAAPRGEPPARRGPDAPRPAPDGRREPPAPQREPTSPAARVGSSRAVLVDEFVQPPAAGRGRARGPAPVANEPSRRGAGARGRGRDEGRALPWDIPLAGERPPSERDRRRDAGAQPGRGAETREAPEISVLRRRPPRERE